MFNKLMKFFGVKLMATVTYYAARGCSDVWLMRNAPIDWLNQEDYVASNSLLKIPELESIKPGEVRKITILVEVME